MPICTWLSDSEKELYSKVFDPELDELFQEVRNEKGANWYLQERPVNKRSFWGALSVDRFYTLYYDCGHEVQIINFPPPEPQKSSINTSVRKEYIITFFYGLLANITPNP